MNKTPEEIKQGLKCCIGDDEDICCNECAYCGEIRCVRKMTDDTLALIQKLQAENAEQAELIEYLKSEIEEFEESADKCCYESRCNAELNKLEALCKRLMDENEQLEDHLREATKKIEQLEAERDAAVEDLHYLVNHPQSAGPCYACKHTDECYSGGDCDPVENDRWEWRGVQKEE